MKNNKPIYKSKLFKLLIIILVILGIIVSVFVLSVKVHPPLVDYKITKNIYRKEISPNVYICKDSWLKKNKYGLWEMYLKGSAFELGVKNGILSSELIEQQEAIFLENINEMVPSKMYLNVLKYFILWFNRNIDEHIPLEFQKEIYGVSLHASDKFNYIGPAYHRMLNYHAAHDIGHTLQNMNLVGCTAFEVSGDKSEDSTILIGKNMDFSSGDDFAENKIIAFYEPDSGHKFCTITWGGMIGVISGMNDKGLVVTLNAAKSKIPTSTGTPVSILARMILQYASNIDEAYAIANKMQIFVSESFLISSSVDKKTVVIEKSTDNIGLFETGSNQLILTNHYQGEKLKNTEINIQSLKEGASLYRWERTAELLNKCKKHNVESFALILRDQKGKNNKDIGMGNEKSINQLIAHHSVIFKPEKLQIWVSSNPYQLGAYISYNLNDIFGKHVNVLDDLYDSSLTIKEDAFLKSPEFKKYKEYKIKTKMLKYYMSNDNVMNISDKEINYYRNLNPNYYYTYYVIGEYYRLKNDKINAIKNYNIALNKEIPRTIDRKQILDAKKKANEDITL